MTTLAEIRAQHPEYNDMSDAALASALHAKFYADMPEAEFNQKIGLSAAPAPAADPNAGIVPQGLSGVNEGIAGTLGFPVDATNDVLRAGAAGLKALGGPDIELPMNAFGGSQTFKNLMGPAITPTTDDGTGQFARRIGQEVGASAVPMLGAAAASSRPLASLAMNVGTTLAGGTGAAVADKAYPNNQLADVAGELIGGSLVGGIPKVITPFAIKPERAAMNDVMAQNGVDLTAGQKTGSKGLQYAESELGGGAAQDAVERQQQQFTSAALSRAGISADRATPEVMNQAFNDLGHQFDTLASSNTLVPDRQLGSDLHDAVTHYESTVSPSNQAPIVRDTLGDIVNYAQNGQISGPQYADLRSRLNSAARQTAQSDPPLSSALFGIQGALDDSMERSIAQSNPSALGQWQQTRNDYRNLIVLEKASTGAGENAANGLISPAKLRQAAVGQNARAYVRGTGDFSDLARAGVATMSPLPQSGTAPRLSARNIGAAIPAVVGSGLGGNFGGIPGALAGAAAGAAAPALIGKALMSGPGQRYLSNQLWSNPIQLGSGMVGPLSSALIQQAQPTQ